MSMLEVGKKIVVQSYKHDESLHRIWQEATVLAENDDYIIVANKKTKVIEANGRFWHTKEPSVTYFYKHHWFNVIGIIKEDGVSYYCNLSSPILYDEEALKYIDYDLDIKVLPDYSYNLLDQNEYRRHKSQMSYSPELSKIIENELKILETMVRKQTEPFEQAIILKWYDFYLNQKIK
jgi:hypothetical protein